MQKIIAGNYKGKAKPKSQIGIMLLMLAAVGSGILIGMLYVSLFLKGLDYSNFTEEGLRDKESEIFSKYGSADIASLSGVNAFIVAEQKVAAKNIVSMDASGNINAMGVKQNIYTKKYRNGNSYFVENISKGQVILGVDTNIAERNYYDLSSDLVKIYKGSNIQQTSATFNDLKEQMSLSQWKEKNGTTPLNFQPYIVSSKTIESATNPTACTLEGGKRGYYIKMSLKATSAFLYVKQIKNLSGLGDYPNFNYINIEVYLNSDGTFNKIVCSEKYTVKKMGMNVGTTSVMTYTFNYEAKEIPTI